MRRPAWSSASERQRIREKMALAGNVGAWIPGPHINVEFERRRRVRLNELAQSCGLNPPYSDIEHGAPFASALAENSDAQRFRCCVRGCTETQGLIGEHSTPNVWKWGKPNQLMCVVHHKVKTWRDIQAIWKAKLRGRGFERRP